MATGQPNSLPKATTSSGEVRTSDRPGTPETPGPLGGVAGADLVAHDLDGLGRGPDEGHAPLGDGPGEVGVLGEEAVAGVDGVGPALLDGLEDRLGVEVALGRRLAPQGVGLVGQPDVERVPVELGVDGHGGHAHLPAGPDDPDGDLSPVGDENLLQHAAPFESWTSRRVSLAADRGATTLSRPVGYVPCRARPAVTDADHGGPAAPGSPRCAGSRLDSTNRYLLDEARAGAPEGLVAVADHQTAGRGRLGRRWEAPPGANLLVSVLLRPVCPLDARHLASAGGGPGRRRRRARTWPAWARWIKWPNDLLVGRAEAGRGAGRGRPGRLRVLPGPSPIVVGIGINVDWPRPPSDDGPRPRAGSRRRPPRCAGSAGRVGRPRRSCSTPCSPGSSPGGRPGHPRRPGAGRPPTCGPGAPPSGARSGSNWPTRRSRGRRSTVTAEGHLVVDVDRDGPRTVVAGDVVHLRPRPEPARGSPAGRPRVDSPGHAIFWSPAVPASSGPTSSVTGSSEHPDDAVVAYDVLTYAGNRPNLADVEDRIAFVQGDIGDLDTVAKTLDDHQIDVIVNFAAESHNTPGHPGSRPGSSGPTCWGPRPCWRRPAGTVSPGSTTSPPARSTGIWLSTATSGSPRRRPTGPVRRTTPPRPAPTTPSGPTWRPSALPATITNCCNNYGPYQFPEKVIPLFTAKALDDQPLPLYASTQNRREWLHVDDHCRAIEAVLSHGEVGETYNVGSGIEASIEEIADAVLAATGRPSTLKEIVPDRPSHDRRYLLDSPRSAGRWAGSPPSTSPRDWPRR